MPFSTVVASHHLACYINGNILGLITDMQFTVDTDWRAETVIDTNVPVEMMPGQRRVRGSFGILRGRANGSLEALGMTSFARNMLKQKLFTIQLKDRLTGRVMFEAVKCAMQNQTWKASPKQVVTGSFTWEGIDYTNDGDV
jgi:hypothetical protein